MIQEITSDYALYNGDCIEVMRDLPSNSVGLSVYSPPFCGLYQYSSDERDLSNCRSYEEFFEHYEFVVEQIARLTKPGRISAVHCMDTPKDGANICGYKDFPGDIIRLHEKHGFEYTPRICIWKEPLAVRNRTMSKALAHRQIVEDSTRVNIAAADYLIPFRKIGENKEPVTHPVGLLSYAGARQIPHELQQYRGHTGKQTENRFSHWIWRQYASSVWDDIRGNTGERTDVGVLPFREAKDEQDERHVHPLQLDVIERAVVLWSNPGDVVLTPFMGVGSEVYTAVKMGRKGIGMELKATYFEQAKVNIADAKNQREQLDLSIEEKPVTEALQETAGLSE
jgi:DNA modification methylase